MSISYKFYKTIDNWWVIYYFNVLSDVTFAVISDDIIEDNINDIINMIKTIPTKQERGVSKELLISYFYNNTLNFKESVAQANDFLAGNRSDPTAEEFYALLKQYLNNYFIINQTYLTELKIPSITMIYQMKNRMNQYSDRWKENNQ
jgi:hypothetical protein